MFTGLVQAMGRVVERREAPAGVRLVVEVGGGWGYRPRREESIAVNGCCLTVANEPGAGGVVEFDVIHETLRKTSLGRLHPGDKVNLEHALAASGLLGGHLVQGHVDGAGRVLRNGDAGDGGGWRMRVAPEGGRELMQYIVPKGSIAVDGVSLTVAGVDVGGAGGGGGEAGGWFEVALIPTTLELTNLGARRAGDVVNLEVDVVAKTVVHWLRHYGGK